MLLLKRDRALAGAALLAVTAIAWVDLVYMARDMNVAGGVTHWSAGYFAAMFAMWVVMMVGMMAPSAAPMILMYARVGRQGKIAGKPLAATGWFAAGYFLAWAGFSLAATLVQ